MLITLSWSDKAKIAYHNDYILSKLPSLFSFYIYIRKWEIVILMLENPAYIPEIEEKSI